jgi:DNA-binding response OmpR family regulator
MTSWQSRKQTVLLVEDDAMLRSILAQALAEEGFDVLTAEDGEPALAIASSLEGQLGLVVTDIRLPAMNGLELAAGLARLKPPPPVLFISGVSSDRKNLASPVLAKPFGPSAFLKQVAQMLPSAQQHTGDPQTQG